MSLETSTSKNHIGDLGRPSFSIVVTCYNLEHYIRESIESCCSQDYPGLWEVIVVDDCSSDDSCEVIEQYMREHPDCGIRFVRRKVNGGVAAATDTAVALARYEWIVLADGDDVQQPDRLSLAAGEIARHPEIRFLTMSMNSMSADGTVTGRQLYLSHASASELPERIVKTTPQERYANMEATEGKLTSTGAGGMFHRSLYEKFGTLQGDIEQHLEQDPILMFRAMLVGPVMGTLAIACNYRNHSGNLTNITLPHGVRGVMAFERHQDKYLYLHTRTLMAELRDLQYAMEHPEITDWDSDMLEDANRYLRMAIEVNSIRQGWWSSPWSERLRRCVHNRRLRQMALRLLPFPLFCLAKHMQKTMRNS